MRTFFTTHWFPGVLLFTVLALVILLIITYYVDNAKRKSGYNLLYLFIGGLFIGIVGIRSDALANPFYFYMVVMVWNLISGVIHLYLSGRILIWPKTEGFGWRILFALAVVLFGIAGLLTFMKLAGYDLAWQYYNFSAVLTFFIPLLILYAYECYTLIPKKIYLAKPWIYNRNNELQFRSDQISHFLIIKYRLSPQLNGKTLVDSLPMRAPENIKLGDYFDSTLEVRKVTQGKFTLELKDNSNNNLGWYFFLAEGVNQERMLDPNKTFHECGLTNTVYFGNPSTEEIENITYKADREGKSYLIILKREQEYKEQLMKSQNM
jgi:hypothetical protein